MNCDPDAYPIDFEDSVTFFTDKEQPDPPADDVEVDSGEIDVAIPDNTTGIEVPLAVSAAGSVKDLWITVQIDHTYISDLVVSLRAPDGTTVDLHRFQGGSSDDLTVTYGTGATAPYDLLSPFLGMDPLGEWKLLVADAASGDVGAVRRVVLKLDL